MWDEFEKIVNEKNIICYGAGNNAKHLMKNTLFQPYLDNIICFVDRDEAKIGNVFWVNNKPLLINGYSRIDDITDEIVVVTILEYKEIGNELTQRGITWFAWTEMQMDIVFRFLMNRNNERIAILLNTPNYANLGDHAITIAEIDILKMYYNRVFELDTGMCTEVGLRRLKEYIHDDDVIYIQGGGNMGALWRTCENNIRRIIKEFPNNKIFIFPQSIYYGDTEENQIYLRESISIYDSHNQLTICLRDKQSYEFVNENYICNSVLVPDMVLSLNYDYSYEREGIGVLLRDDKEKAIDRDYINCINDVINRMSKKAYIISHHLEDNIEDREARLMKMLEMYSRCELIITDRLHGMIFSVITNTPCIVFDNSYGKIMSLYQSWLRDNESVTVTKQLETEELEKLAIKQIKTIAHKFQSDKFKRLIIKEFVY